MHDYIFSAKDFCDTVLQKKLVPELYLSGMLNTNNIFICCKKKI